MRDVFLILQIIISLALSALILLQVKGTGFGRVWGGLSTHSSRRGIEGVVFKVTFLLAFLFIIVSLTTLVIDGN